MRRAEQPRVEQLIKDDVDFKNKKVNQFDLPSYYKAKYVTPDRPIQTVHGLQNYSGAVKLGDNRIQYEKSFAASCFNPPICEHKVDYGLTDDMVKENRRRDYEYALKMTSKEDLNAIERIMREKLTQKSKAGIYQLRQVFKYFDRSGCGTIQLPECRNAFRLMGFSFSETQVTALFAQLDMNLEGEIPYQDLLSLLMEKDFLEVKPIWLRSNSTRPDDSGSSGAVGGIDEKDDASGVHSKEVEFEQDIQQSLLMEEEEIYRLFSFVNRNESGFLDRDELTVLLVTLGIKFEKENLWDMVDDVLASTKGGQSKKVDFQGFWAWWLHHHSP